MKRRTFLSRSLACTASLALPLSMPKAAEALSTKPLNLLVLGGTNFVGPAIVEAALARGHNVTLFNRGITRPNLFGGLEKLRGYRSISENNLDALHGTRKWDAVIDVWPEHSRLVEATATLLVDRVDYYYFVSSIAVYRDFSQPGLDEDAEVRVGEQGYGGEKVASEAIVSNLYEGRYGVGRCHAIFGYRDPGSTLHYWLRRLSQHDEVVAPGNGKDPIQFVDVRDVAAWTVGAIERKQPGVFNLAGRPIGFSDFLEACRQAVGMSPSLVWMEKDFIYDQGVRSFDELPVWIPQSEDPGFFRISARKAEDAGAVFRPPVATIAEAWRWYQSAFFKDTIFPHNGWGISRTREQELLEAWKNHRTG